MGAKLYGNLTATELQEYTTACFAVLVAGGNHSFNEVFMVANQIGVPYEMGNYALSLPDSFKQTAAYQKINETFGHFLEKENIAFVSDMRAC